MSSPQRPKQKFNSKKLRKFADVKFWESRAEIPSDDGEGITPVHRPSSQQASGIRQMTETSYLFIDGAYLDTVYRDVFKPVFGEYELDFDKIRTFFDARRVYYYHCLDDDQNPGESDADYKKRVTPQLEAFAKIERVEGVHVRKGFLTKPKKQQKEVDVALAVDMLTHSFYKNITTAILISGDRDFRPAVESVARLGTYVRLVSRPQTTAEALTDESDSFVPLTLKLLMIWVCPPTTFNFPKLLHDGHHGFFDTLDHWMKYKPATSENYTINKGDKGTLVEKATTQDEWCRATIHLRSNHECLCTVQVAERESEQYSLFDRELLRKFIDKMYGPFKWQVVG